MTSTAQTTAQTSENDKNDAEHVLYFDDLPHAKTHPNRNVIIFDGDCNFCLQQVRKLRWADGKADRLSYVSLHDPFVAEKYPDLKHEDLMNQLYVIDLAGNRYAGANGFRYLTRKVPIFWPLAPILHIPFTLPLWQACYRWIAARRYRIAGKNRPDEQCDHSCKLHL